MIVDFHTHIFPDEFAHKAVKTLASKVTIIPSFLGKKQELLVSMKTANIDYSVILPVVTKPSQTAKANEWAASMQKDGIISFGGLHPQNEDWKAQIDNATLLGLKGIKMHPDYQDFFVDDKKLFPIYEYILNKNLILLFHSGEDIGLPPPTHCTPFRLRKVIDALKGGIIVAAHLGGFRMWDEVLKHLVGTNIYFDTSMGLEYYGKDIFLEIVNNHSSEKILFGTDAPWCVQKDELNNMKALNLEQKVFENITFNNAAKILKLV